jgi:hypothetical protein
LAQGCAPAFGRDCRSGARHAIDHFEVYTGFKDFGSFNKEQALSYKKALIATKGRRSGKPISTATAYHVLQSLKKFLAWLHGGRAITVALIRPTSPI